MSDVDITMPQLGETVSDGTVSRWLIAEGATVQADEPVLEVSTDKVDTEVVAPVSGTLRRIVVQEGDTVDVGTVLASLEVATDSDDEPVRDADLTEESPATAQPSVAPGEGASGAGLGGATLRTGRAVTTTAGHRHRHTPRVRRLAREHGVTLDNLQGTGPQGRVTPSDVLGSAESQVETPSVEPVETRSVEPVETRSVEPKSVEPVETKSVEHKSVEPVETKPVATKPGDSRHRRVERLSRRRRVIAERMHRSLQESAQLTTVVEVDLTRVVETREQMKAEFRARYGVSISVLSFVAEAAVKALGEHPVIHAELDLQGGTVAYPTSVDLGIAVDTDQGLVVPVIRDADDLSVGGLARRIAEVAARSRDGSATADDYAGGTFTITNTGSRGALFDTPILNAPQAAILGLGATVRRPTAVRSTDGEEVIAVRSMAYLSLTYDHRLVDGADAARFLTGVKERLESVPAATETGTSA